MTREAAELITRPTCVECGQLWLERGGAPAVTIDDSATRLRFTAWAMRERRLFDDD
jgi:hypothetical protein